MIENVVRGTCRTAFYSLADIKTILSTLQPRHVRGLELATALSGKVILFPKSRRNHFQRRNAQPCHHLACRCSIQLSWGSHPLSKFDTLDWQLTYLLYHIFPSHGIFPQYCATLRVVTWCHNKDPIKSLNRNLQPQELYFVTRLKFSDTSIQQCGLVDINVLQQDEFQSKSLEKISFKLQTFNHTLLATHIWPKETIASEGQEHGVKCQTCSKFIL